MKVHELIEKLKQMPQNLEVFVYSSVEEGDGYADEVMLCHKNPEYFFQAKEYYCCGDSIMALYLGRYNMTEAVVIGSCFRSCDDDYEADSQSEICYPCDHSGDCPFGAVGGYDCRNFCGLGVDEDEPEDEE